jgi:mono/diheme cytochrome c family protein
MRRLLEWGAVIAVVALVAVQFVPYGRDHTNPPVTAEPAWDSAETRELAGRACLDCHSNETRWPWYSNVAPVSWFVQRDVDEGRAELNWSTPGFGEGEESEEAVREGWMPPRSYTLLHWDARLSPDEIDALARGLQATFGQARSD